MMQLPTIENYDKGLLGQIYTINQSTSSGSGSVIGFRADGSKAVPYSATDGSFFDSVAAQVAFGDLNGDGFDDAVFVTGANVIAWDIKNDTMLWCSTIADAPHIGPIGCSRKPIIADINGDGKPEVVVFTWDNNQSGGDVEHGASTLDVFSATGKRYARQAFNAYSYAPAMCVGHFLSSLPGLQIALIALEFNHQTVSDSNWQYKLWLLGNLDTTAGTLSVISPPKSPTLWITGSCPLLWQHDCREFRRKRQRRAYLLHRPKRYRYSRRSQPVDSLLIYKIDNSSGALSRVAQYHVGYAYWTIFASAPALADIDGSGNQDIVLATDDSIYVLKFDGNAITPIVPTIHFGRVPSTRNDQSATTPQALVANIGGRNVIIANHSDGNIWAFDITKNNGVWQATSRSGFPMKTQGNVYAGCAVADLQGNDSLELVALDEAGYIFTWTRVRRGMQPALALRIRQ